MLSPASVQRKAKTPTPESESSLERQADRAAEQVVLRRFAGVPPGLSALPGGTRVQKKCACGGTCDKCKHEEEEARIQRAPDGGAPPLPAPAAGVPATDPANPVQAPATAVLVDDGQPVGPDQMARSVFMGALRSRLFAVCDEELAPLGKSSQGCPYLNQWLGYYEGRPAPVIERSIQRYTGATAKKPQELIEAVVLRVRGAVRVWATTGAVSGIPGAAADAATAAVGAVTGLFRKSEAAGAPAPAHSPSTVQAQLAGGGGGLEPGVRSRMERGFGRSFAGVRVHTDPTAARLSRSLSARAFTVGSDVAFAAGQYRPGTVEGDLLIAHELAHTVQQSGARGDLVQSGGSDRLFEDDADRAAAGVVGSELGILDRAEPQRRTGLRLQGCSQEVIKVCPKNYKWKVQGIIGVGSAGCQCRWKCMPYRSDYVSSPRRDTVQCPSYMNCDSGVRYETLGEDYEKTGWGANMTPLGEQPWCGCFPLTKDGVQITDAPLRPSDIELTDVAQPVADLAAAGAAKLRGTRGPGSQVSPLTGTIQPDDPPPAPRPEKPGMTPPPSHVGEPPTPGKAPTPDEPPPSTKPPVTPPGATPPAAPGAKVPHEYTPEARSLAKRTGMPLDEAAAVSETLAKNSTKTGGKQMMGESEIAQHFGIEKNSKKLPEALVERNDGKFVAVEAKNQNEPDITNAIGKFRDTSALVTAKYGKYRMGGYELYVKQGYKGFNDKSYTVEGGQLYRDGAPVKIDGVGVTVKERDLGPVGGKE